MLHKIVNERKNQETGAIDFTNANTVINVLSDVVSKSVSNTIQCVMPTVIAACITQIKDNIKDEIRKEVMQETSEFVKVVVSSVNKEITEKMVQTKYETDKLEAYGRRFNLVISGINEDISKQRNPSSTVDKVVNELANISCEINNEDLSSCYRLYRKNRSITAPNPIMISFISQKV